MKAEDMVQVYGSERSNTRDRKPRRIIVKEEKKPLTQEQKQAIIDEEIEKQHPVNLGLEKGGFSFKSTKLIRMETKAKAIMERQKRRDGYVYHMTTTNLSFLQTSKDLASLGIKNNKFFLRLYDTRLIDVDPHDPNLSEELKFAVINECICNPWYYLRECCLLPMDGSVSGQRYILNRANLAATFCMLNHIDHYLVIPRQTGKTQSTIAIITWTFLFGTASTQMMFVNKDQGQANENLDRLKKQRDLLPEYMRMKELVTADGKLDKGKDNVTMLTNPVTRNSIVTKPRATSKERAVGIGRGATQTVQYYDEVEFTEHIAEIVNAAGPAYNTASKNAAANNAAHCRIFTSTPGDLDTDSAQQGLSIIERAGKWTERFYDWTREQITEYIRMNSENRIVYIEYNYKQLGFDEEWFIQSCINAGNIASNIKREILLQRLHGSNASPFDMEDLQIIESLKQPVKKEVFLQDVFRFDFYGDIDPMKTYILSVDCATGVGVDSTAFTLIDPYYLRPVAEFSSPWIGGPQTARLLTEFVKTYTPRAIVAVERNSIGNTILDILSESEIQHNIYFETSNDLNIDDKYDARGMLIQEAARRRNRGVWTGNSSRPLMMKILEEMVLNDKEAFVTENITSQLMTLVRKKSGKIEHADGKHDDSLMSYLIGLYVYYHGKNLSAFGFTRGLPDEKERNTGLKYEDVIKEVDDDVKEIIGNAGLAKEQSDYSRQVYEENARYRKQMESINPSIGSNAEVVDFNASLSTYDFEDSFFDELND